MTLLNIETENIRKNIILPFVLIITTLTLVFVISAGWLQEKHLQENTLLVAEQYSRSFSSAVQKESELLIGLAHLLSRDQQMISLWKKQDRESLYQYTAPFFETFQKNHNISHFYFHQIDQHVFLRTHKKTAFGDLITRYTMRQAAQLQTDSIGLEMGTIGLFVLRAVTPVYDNRQLIGYLELGKEIDDISLSLSKSLGVDLMFVINKDLIEKQQYEEYVNVNHLQTTWDIFDDRILVSSTIDGPQKDINKLVFKFDISNELFETVVNDKKFHALWKNLRDASGQDVGEVLLLQDVTTKKSEITRLWQSLLVVAVLLTFIISYFYYQYLKRVESKLDNLVKRLGAEVKGHFKAQELLKHSNRRLQHLNSELESYSYSLAHDLRTPLRAVTSFSQILKEDISAKLDDEEKNLLQRIVAAGKHMADLIQDILRLAHIAQEELQVEPIDLSAIAQNSIQQLQAAHPERLVDVHIEPNLHTIGSRVLLGLLLDNLVGNAWKYTSKNSLSTIVINSLQRDGKTIFYVKDNGIGVDEQYIQNIFKPFQRLPNAKTFEGTGIGLAICKRIIDRHDGDLWLESNPDQGVTFFFTIGVRRSEEK